MTDLILEINTKISNSMYLEIAGEKHIFQYNQYKDIVEIVRPTVKLRDIFNKNKTENQSKVHFLPSQSRLMAYDIPRFKLEKITLQNRLSIQLGFPPENNLFDFQASPFPTKINFGIPDQFFVYCDIIDYQIIGNTYSKVLKIVTIEKDKNSIFGSNISKTFSPIQYLKLSEKSFDEISIHIKDGQGLPVPFLYGTLLVQLHFIDE